MNITIVGVPYQLDVGRWCYALGPHAFLDHGLRAQLESLGHRVTREVWIELPKVERARDTVTNLANIARRTSSAVANALREQDSFALLLEGDCTHAVGAVGGMARALGKPGVAWFDAHADLHTLHSTTSGYIGGMPFAVALGWEFDDWRLAAGLETAVRENAAALLGASDIDPEEEIALRRSKIARLDAAGMRDEKVAELLDALLKPRRTHADAWYLHVDVDVAGPDVVPGGMTPTSSPPRVEDLLAAVSAAVQVLSPRVMGIATYNPSGDPAGKGIEFAFRVIRAAFRDSAK
jgi:arginase